METTESVQTGIFPVIPLWMIRLGLKPLEFKMFCHIINIAQHGDGSCEFQCRRFARENKVGCDAVRFALGTLEQSELIKKLGTMPNGQAVYYPVGLADEPPKLNFDHVSKARGRSRNALAKKTRFEVLKKCGFSCVYCGRKPPEAVLNIDHVIPVSKGGGNEIGNLVAACRDCNTGKSDRN